MMSYFDHYAAMIQRVQDVQREPPVEDTHADGCPCRDCEDEALETQDQDSNTFREEIGDVTKGTHDGD